MAGYRAIFCAHGDPSSLLDELAADSEVSTGLVRDARRDERDGDLSSDTVFPPAAGGQSAFAGRSPCLMGLEHQGQAWTVTLRDRAQALGSGLP